MEQITFEFNDPREPEKREGRLALRREQYAASDKERADRQVRHARARERHSANHRRWYLANREARIEANRLWREANPEKALALARLRNYRRSYGLTPEAIDYAHIVLADPCVYCGAACEHVDHIEPLAGGGTNEWDNLTGACQSCNGSKCATPLLRFLLRRR